jgi:hypothetical protein
VGVGVRGELTVLRLKLAHDSQYERWEVDNCRAAGSPTLKLQLDAMLPSV